MADVPVGAILKTGAVVGAAVVGGLVAAKIATSKDAVSQGNALGLIQRLSGGRGGGSLVFPGDLLNNKNFYMSIGFVKYQRRSIFDPPDLPPVSGGIYLPIPDNLTDNQSVVYNQAESPVVGALIEGSIKGGRGGKGALENLENIGGGLASAVQSTVLNAAESLAGKVASLAGTTATNVVPQVLQLGGMAQNPFLTVLFKQPAFKTHLFSWKLNPANETESQILSNIVTTIRANMLPNMIPGQGGTLLGYPNMAIVQLSNEEYLYKFKPCVVETMQVNFAPGTTPGFFKGTNAPTQVVLTIQLKEIEYWLQEDVTGDSRAAGVFDLAGVLSPGRE